MELNDHLRQMLKELGQAINESISGSGRVHESIQRIREEGYNLYMVLDAKVGVNRRESAKNRPRRRGRRAPAAEGLEAERATFRINVKDLRFLKSVGIDPTRKVRARRGVTVRVGATRVAAPLAPGSRAPPPRRLRPVAVLDSQRCLCLPIRSASRARLAGRGARARSLPRYRGGQIFDALHRRGRARWDAMAELPGALRERLAREAPLRLPEIARREESADGSRKYGLRLADGALIEAVFMPGDSRRAAVNEFEDARAEARGRMPKADRQRPPSASHAAAEKYTVCLSSQTGCAVDCAFCVTGRLGGGRNLTAGEILGQLYAVAGRRRPRRRRACASSSWGWASRS